VVLRVIAATAHTQFRLMSRNIEDVLPIIVMPLQTLVAMAILVESGRTDLAGYALSASLLFTVGQMGFFISSEIVSNDRNNQLMELLVATPAPYVVILATRTLILSSLGLFGFVEGWLIAYVVFGIAVPIPHPEILAITLAATALAGGGTAVLTATLFSLSRNTRSLQNAANGPFYLLGGILVPVTFLPVWLQPLSPLIFFYWSANLVRDSLQEATPQNVALRLAILLGLGIAAAIGGGVVMTRMLDRLRHDGRLGLT
jgi:ABC-2 type transport system permease protein